MEGKPADKLSRPLPPPLPIPAKNDTVLSTQVQKGKPEKPSPKGDDDFLIIDYEKKKLVIRRQFKGDRYKTKCATVAAAMLRKLTNDKNEHRVDRPQTISLHLAFNALGMLRSILDCENQYNNCFEITSS